MSEAPKPSPGPQHPAPLERLRHDFDLAQLRRYRLARVREQLRLYDCAAAVLYDSVNIRYASDTSYMPVFGMHFMGRHLFVPQEGPVVLFEKPHMAHLWGDAELIDELRPAVAWRSVHAGPDVEHNVRRWASEMADLVRRYGGDSRRLAIDRCEPAAAAALHEAGMELVDAQEPMERARSIKSTDEVGCMQVAMDVSEIAMRQMQEQLIPGITENQLWSILGQVNLAYGGEWLECRLLTSGRRTNPWLQEASDKVIESGELVAFDTDMVGPYGYCSDVSRTYLCPDAAPTSAQRTLYRLAAEELQHNMELMQPGLSLREVSQRAWPVPERYRENSYRFIAHGVGMCDEWPNCYQPDVLEKQREGDMVLEPGMVMCVESYIGETGGSEGVKLEQQVLITGDGHRLLSRYPLDRELLGTQY